MTAPTLGALVITRDEERHLGDCLRSLAFCDERVVVDSFSRDRTVEIACELADHVYCRDFVHHADQKNWGLTQLHTDWVLIVDADERVPEDLAREVRARVEQSAHLGYWIHRRNHFFGREIHHAGWDRDKVLRLFRRDVGHYPDAWLHEEIALREGATAGHCQARLIHHSYEDWDSSFARLLSYSTRGAIQRARRGRRARVRDLAVRPAARFFRQYLLQRGFADGRHGVALCAWSAAGVFLREAKLLLGDLDLGANAGNPDVAPRVRAVKGRPPVPAIVPDRRGGDADRQETR